MDKYILRVNGEDEITINGDVIRYKDNKTNKIFLYVSTKLEKEIEELIFNTQLEIKINNQWESVTHVKTMQNTSHFWVNKEIKIVE